MLTCMCVYMYAHPYAPRHTYIHVHILLQGILFGVNTIHLSIFLGLPSVYHLLVEILLRQRVTELSIGKWVEKSGVIILNLLSMSWNVAKDEGLNTAQLEW